MSCCAVPQGALLLVLLNVSHLLEDRLTRQAGRLLEELLRSMPDNATVVLSNDSKCCSQQTVVMKAEDVPVGSHILIKPGEQVTQVF